MADAPDRMHRHMALDTAARKARGLLRNIIDAERLSPIDGIGGAGNDDLHCLDLALEVLDAGLAAGEC